MILKIYRFCSVDVKCSQSDYKFFFCCLWFFVFVVFLLLDWNMSSHKLIQFRNCKILRNHEIISDDIWVRNGLIVNPEKVFFDEKNLAHQQIDCKGALICPGFIELQINGECEICLLLFFLAFFISLLSINSTSE